MKLARFLVRSGIRPDRPGGRRAGPGERLGLSRAHGRRNSQRRRRWRLGRLRGHAQRRHPFQRRGSELAAVGAGGRVDLPGPRALRRSRRPGEGHLRDSLRLAGRGGPLVSRPRPLPGNPGGHRPRAALDGLRRSRQRDDLEVDGRRIELAAAFGDSRGLRACGLRIRFTGDLRVGPRHRRESLPLL